MDWLPLWFAASGFACWVLWLAYRALDALSDHRRLLGDAAADVRALREAVERASREPPREPPQETAPPFAVTPAEEFVWLRCGKTGSGLEWPQLRDAAKMARDTPAGADCVMRGYHVERPRGLPLCALHVPAAHVPALAAELERLADAWERACRDPKTRRPVLGVVPVAPATSATPAASSTAETTTTPPEGA